MKTVITFLILASTASLSAQSWPDSDSRWIYEFWAIGEAQGQEEFYVGTDTVIDGMMGRNILHNRYTTIPTGPDGGTFTISSVNQYTNTLFTQGDSVLYLDLYYMAEPEIRLLYDYGASVGDSWLFAVNNFSDCWDTAYVSVTGVGSMMVAGESRRYIDLESSPEAEAILEGRAVEGIGLIEGTGYGFFPGWTSVDVCEAIYEVSFYTFSCYSDSEIGTFPEGNGPCSFVGLEELSKTPLSVFPNPAEAGSSVPVTVLLPASMQGEIQQGSDITLYDGMGRAVLGQAADRVSVSETTITLDISAVTPGAYFLVITTKQGVPRIARLTVK